MPRTQHPAVGSTTDPHEILTQCAASCVSAVSDSIRSDRELGSARLSGGFGTCCVVVGAGSIPSGRSAPQPHPMHDAPAPIVTHVALHVARGCLPSHVGPRNEPHTVHGRGRCAGAGAAAGFDRQQQLQQRLRRPSPPLQHQAQEGACRRRGGWGGGSGMWEAWRNHKLASVRPLSTASHAGRV